jgi:hypothetical protein
MLKKLHGCSVFCVLLSLISITALAEGVTWNPADDLPLETMEPPPTTEGASTPAPPLVTPAESAGPGPITTAPSKQTPEARAVETPTSEQPPQKAEDTFIPAESEVTPSAIQEYQNTEEEILRSPTKSIETYEEIRKNRLIRQADTNWSFNVTLAPNAFKGTEFRQTLTGPILSGERPFFIGVLFSTDYYLIKQIGYFSLGVEAGLYSSQPTNRFGTLLATFQSAGPYAQYQFRYFERQWLVPTIRAKYEWVHYNYSFSDNHMSDARVIPRLDLGGLIFLNVIEPSSTANISNDFGIKKVYFGVYYTIAQDKKIKHFDLSERAFRGVLRFEF